MNLRRSIISAVVLVLLAAGADAAPGSGGAWTITVDGNAVETAAPPLVRGRYCLVPGDLVVQHARVSIKWSKKRMALANPDSYIVIPNDGGKKGGAVVEEIPMVPVRFLQNVFNIKIKWDRVQETITLDTKEKFNPFKEEKPPPERAAPGERIPDFILSDLEGTPVPFSSFVGRRVALVVFAPWDISRGHLGQWQEFKEENGDDPLQIVAVGIDAEGPKMTKRFSLRAEVDFPVLVDQGGVLPRLFGFRNVPVIIVADELGAYQIQIPPYSAPKNVFRALKRYMKDPIRSEYIAKPERTKPPTKKEIRARAKKMVLELQDKPGDIPLRIKVAEWYRSQQDWKKAIEQMEHGSRADKKSAEVIFRWGLYLHLMGSKAEAVEKFREAVPLEPKNWIIRKQIWAIEHPERFYRGKIDLAWQQVQIQKGI